MKGWMQVEENGGSGWKVIPEDSKACAVYEEMVRARQLIKIRAAWTLLACDKSQGKGEDVLQ